jgi:hypothetical protein
MNGIVAVPVLHCGVRFAGIRYAVKRVAERNLMLGVALTLNWPVL